MRVLHGVVIGFVALALGARVALEEPESFRITGPAALAAFLVAGGALSLDFLDRRWRWLAATVVLAAAALAVAFVR